MPAPLALRCLRPLYACVGALAHIFGKVSGMSLDLVRLFPDVKTLNLGGGYKVGALSRARVSLRAVRRLSCAMGEHRGVRVTLSGGREGGGCGGDTRSGRLLHVRCLRDAWSDRVGHFGSIVQGTSLHQHLFLSVCLVSSFGHPPAR